jgi:hypothetical protein
LIIFLLYLLLIHIIKLTKFIKFIRTNHTNLTFFLIFFLKYKHCLINIFILKKKINQSGNISRVNYLVRPTKPALTPWLNLWIKEKHWRQTAQAPDGKGPNSRMGCSQLNALCMIWDPMSEKMLSCPNSNGSYRYICLYLTSISALFIKQSI